MHRLNVVYYIPDTERRPGKQNHERDGMLLLQGAPSGCPETGRNERAMKQCPHSSHGPARGGTGPRRREPDADAPDQA